MSAATECVPQVWGGLRPNDPRGQIIFAEESFFIEAQITRNSAHKPVAKDPAGQPAQSSFSRASTKRERELREVSIEELTKATRISAFCRSPRE